MFQIPSELYDAFISAIEKGNIRTMPNRSMPASPHPTPGALLLGDAFNMRHPLTGGGMTVALSDIVLLREFLRPLHNLNDASALCKYLESFYTLRKVRKHLLAMYLIVSLLASKLQVFKYDCEISSNQSERKGQIFFYMVSEVKVKADES